MKESPLPPEEIRNSIALRFHSEPTNTQLSLRWFKLLSPQDTIPSKSRSPFKLHMALNSCLQCVRDFLLHRH